MNIHDNICNLIFFSFTPVNLNLIFFNPVFLLKIRHFLFPVMGRQGRGYRIRDEAPD